MICLICATEVRTITYKTKKNKWRQPVRSWRSQVRKPESGPKIWSNSNTQIDALRNKKSSRKNAMSTRACVYTRRATRRTKILKPYFFYDVRGEEQWEQEDDTQTQYNTNTVANTVVNILTHPRPTPPSPPSAAHLIVRVEPHPLSCLRLR